MKIKWRVLQRILPGLEERGITGERGVFHAAYLIGKYYCEPLSMVNLCPQHCHKCASHLNRMTSDIHPGDWYAQLVWHAKDERAVVKDLHAAHEAREVSDVGNIFADFAEKLSR